MDHATPFGIRRRAAALWGVVSAAMAGLVAIAGPTACGVIRAPGATFADLLVQACAVAALLAGSALWLATTDVALSVLRDRGSGRRLGPLRSALLAACGVAVLTTTTPASATPADGPGEPTTAEVLEGLPLPDRAVGGPTSDPQSSTTIRVRPGDSLWAIAGRVCGPAASESEIAAYWHRLRTLHASVTGTDPDLIQPGQRLHLPPR